MANGVTVLTSDVADVHDVFISYAHKDNEVALGEKPSLGFVARLVSRIRLYGEMRYRTKLKIFYDSDLASGVLWEKSIYQALDSCRVFVPIVSPSWLDSKWGGAEWDAVFKRVETENLTANRTRIIPVSFELENLLEEFKKGGDTVEEKELQRRLYMVRELQLKQRFRDFMPEEDFKPAAWAVVDDIFNLLGKLKDAPGKPMVDTTKSTVFLGFAFSDQMRKWKENVRNELKANDFDVREVEFRGNETAQQLIDAIQEGVRNSAAAVHFLEERPGPYVTGDRNRGIVQIQCEVVEQVKNPRLFQLFWTGPDLRIDKDVQEESYKEFLEKVKRSDEHMTESVATFVKSLLMRLKEPPKPELKPDHPATHPPATEAPVICVICETEDRDVAESIRSYFTTKGWFVLVPKLDIEPKSEQRSIPDEYARVFQRYERFLFYWGKGGPYWGPNNYYILTDARTLPGGNSKRPLAALLYCGEEKADYKENPTFWGQRLKALRWDRFDPNAAEVKLFEKEVETSSRSNLPSPMEQSLQ